MHFRARCGRRKCKVVEDTRSRRCTGDLVEEEALTLSEHSSCVEVNKSGGHTISGGTEIMDQKLPASRQPLDKSIILCTQTHPSSSFGHLIKSFEG